MLKKKMFKEKKATHVSPLPTLILDILNCTVMILLIKHFNIYDLYSIT